MQGDDDTTITWVDFGEEEEEDDTCVLCNHDKQRLWSEDDESDEMMEGSIRV